MRPRVEVGAGDEAVHASFNYIVAFPPLYAGRKGDGAGAGVRGSVVGRITRAVGFFNYHIFEFFTDGGVFRDEGKSWALGYGDIRHTKNVLVTDLCQTQIQF